MSKPPAPRFFFEDRMSKGYTYADLKEMRESVEAEAQKYDFETEEAKLDMIIRERERLIPVPAIVLESGDSVRKRRREAEKKQISANFTPAEQAMIKAKGSEWARDRAIIKGITTSAFHRATLTQIHGKILHTARNALADPKEALDAICRAKNRWLHRKKRWAAGNFNVSKHLDKLLYEMTFFKLRKLPSPEHVALFRMYVTAL